MRSCNLVWFWISNFIFMIIQCFVANMQMFVHAVIYCSLKEKLELADQTNRSPVPITNLRISSYRLDAQLLLCILNQNAFYSLILSRQKDFFLRCTIYVMQCALGGEPSWKYKTQPSIWVGVKVSHSSTTLFTPFHTIFTAITSRSFSEMFSGIVIKKLLSEIADVLWRCMPYSITWI